MDIDIDYLNVIISALLWPVLVGIFFLIKAFCGLFHKHPLLGTWHVYHYSLKNRNPICIHTRWVFRRGFTRKYKVKILMPNSKRKVYSVVVKEEKGTYRFALSSVNDSETVFIRSTGIFYDGKQYMYGFGVALNFDSHVYSSAHIFTQDELDEESIRNGFRNFFVSNNSLLLSTVR